jgi:hypothetical protein
MLQYCKCVISIVYLSAAASKQYASLRASRVHVTRETVGGVEGRERKRAEKVGEGMTREINITVFGSGILLSHVLCFYVFMPYLFLYCMCACFYFYLFFFKGIMGVNLFSVLCTYRGLCTTP